jgi:hypothetical protein
LLIAIMLFMMVAVSALAAEKEDEGIQESPDGFPLAFFWTQHVDLNLTSAPACAPGCGTSLGRYCPPLLVPGGVLMGHPPAWFSVNMGCSSERVDRVNQNCTCECRTGPEISANCDGEVVTAPVTRAEK